MIKLLNKFIHVALLNFIVSLVRENPWFSLL